MRQQAPTGRRRQPGHQAIANSAAQQPVRGDGQNVAGARRQRQGAQREHRQPPIKIGAEAAGCHFAGQIAIARCNDAHIHGNRPPRAHWLHFAFLQHAQQLGLRRQRQFANFVQKQRAAIGAAHQPRR